MGLTYRHAWSQLKEMEKVSPFPLLERTKGGPGGGGTVLTDETRDLLKRFAGFKHRAREEIERCFSTAFSPFSRGI
ncbi:MAG: hypothetical protein DRP87_00160 [Spirochaetes bacterium]|nr:MAG: hypothetical protein DRP87_00160 [Spirochaetota bacterium]